MKEKQLTQKTCGSCVGLFFSKALIFAAQVTLCDKRHQNAFSHFFLCASTLKFPPHLFNLHGLLLCCQLVSRPPPEANQPKVAGCKRETLGAVRRTTCMKYKNKSLQLPEPQRHIHHWLKMQQAQLSTVSLSYSLSPSL